MVKHLRVAYSTPKAWRLSLDARSISELCAASKCLAMPYTLGHWMVLYMSGALFGPWTENDEVLKFDLAASFFYFVTVGSVFIH